jgi:DNA-binding MarR family transcriptional regulator
MPQATSVEVPRGWADDVVVELTTLMTHLKRRSGDPETSARDFLLAHIDRLAPVRATDLAEHVGLDLSTVSRHLQALEGAGLVRRSPDPDDRRAALLELSDTGRELLERNVRARTELIARATAAWPRRDTTELTRLLHRLTHDLEHL